MPSMTDDLVQWLREQLGKDAELAASGESWSAFDESVHGTRRVDVDHSLERVVACTRAWRAEHIARHDPAQTLREIDAKRRTVDLCEPPLVEVTGPGDTERSFIPGEGPPWGLDVLKLLALPYADRPGYREEWRP